MSSRLMAYVHFSMAYLSVLILTLCPLPSLSVRVGTVKCMDIQGMRQWAVYMKCEDLKQEFCWFGCQSLFTAAGHTSPIKECPCDPKEAFSEQRRIHRERESRDQFVSLMAMDTEKECLQPVKYDCTWYGRCLQTQHSKLSRSVIIPMLKEICEERFAEDEDHARFHHQLQLSLRPVVAFSHMLWFTSDVIMNITFHNMYLTLKGIEQVKGRKDFADFLYKTYKETFKDLSVNDQLDNFRKEMFLDDPIKYYRFTIAVDKGSSQIVDDIVADWKSRYGLEYRKVDPGKGYTKVYVWKNRHLRSESSENDQIYEIIFQGVNSYFLNSTNPSSRAFIDKEGGTMYCVAEIGCIPMAVSYDTATNNSLSKIPQSWDVLKPIMLLYANGDKTQSIDILQQNETCFATKNTTKVFFIVHGFKGNAFKKRIQLTKDALVSRDKTFAVVVMGWYAAKFPVSAGTYNQVAINSYATAAILAYGIRKYFVRPGCLNEGDVHVIGHSVGAHVAGVAGKTIYENYGSKIAKITGLDPAGPWYGDKDPSMRLDPSDATHVEVIHTNVRQDNGTKALTPTEAFFRAEYGVRNPDGDIDFYVNGGLQQPKCSTLFGNSCSHKRSLDYLIESIKTSCKFIGFHCNGTTSKQQLTNCLRGNYTTAVRAVMGLHIPKVQHRGIYYVITTKDTSAFCDEAIAKKYPTP